MESEYFKFDEVRYLQRKCQGAAQESFSCPEELKLVKNYIKTGQNEEALKLVDMAMSNAADLDLKVMALVYRSDVYAEKKKYDLAKRDIEEAIVLKPNIVEFYWRLSMIEKQRGQLGRAEVALILGRQLDPNNKIIMKMLHNIRKLDKVGPNVSDKAGTAQQVRAMQNENGYNFPPGEMAFNLLHPPHVAAILAGDLAKITKLWKPNMVNECYGVDKIKQPLIQMVVHGCQRFQADKSPTPLSKIEEYKLVVDFLFDRGCRLDARDDIGYTSIAYACCVPAQPELLEHFLKKGADPSLKSVFGCTPLLMATLHQNCMEADLLLKFGAKHDEPDNDGVIPIQMAKWNREMVAVLQKYTCPKAPTKKCGRCGANGNSRCTKCRVVTYCSKACQAEHWPEHKKACKKARGSHKKLSIMQNPAHTSFVTDYMKNMSYNLSHAAFDQCEPKESKVWDAKMFDIYKDELKKRGNLVVKVQSPVSGCKGDFLIYNEDRKFSCMADSDALDADDVRAILKSKGVLNKGYFWAYMESGCKDLVLITDPMLPAQSW